MTSLKQSRNHRKSKRAYGQHRVTRAIYDASAELATLPELTQTIGWSVLHRINRTDARRWQHRHRTLTATELRCAIACATALELAALPKFFGIVANFETEVA
jgi:hypothetical protein